MSDDRRDEETGRALGRAIQTQSVRETPYGESRLARRLERPAGRGWTHALPIAAALALFVAMGWFFARGPQGVATPDTSPTPGISATTGPAPTASATASPSATAAAEQVRVYFARDQLPPVGGLAPATAQFSTLSAAERISARVRALWDARAPSGLGNVFGPHTGGAALRSVAASISGETATVVVDAGTWDSLSSAESIALAQQLVYTITEEPGIRRAVIREPGKDHAVVGSGIWKDPQSREDVFGYTPMTAADQRIESNGTAVPADLTSKIDHVQTGGPGQPVLLLIDLAPRQPVPGGSWLPEFTATGRIMTGTALAKYEIEITVPSGTETSLRDQTVNVTPLRYVSVSATNAGTTYRLGVDDARPWRVSVAPGVTAGGMRLSVAIGGYPQLVNRNIAVYAPTIEQTQIGSITIAGEARVFEANVSWRLRDATGREVAKGFTTATNGTGPVWGSFHTFAQIPTGVTGRATLEVFWGSPRDGTDQDVVRVPITIR